MALPELRIVTSSPASDSPDATVVGLRVAEKGPELVAIDGFESLAPQVSTIALSGGSDEVTRLPATGDLASLGSVIVTGLGANVTVDSLRNGAGAVTRKVGGIRSVGFALPLSSLAELEALLTGAAYGAYRFTEFKSTVRELDQAVSIITVYVSETLGTPEERAQVIERASIAAEALALVKDLVNTPAAELYPGSFAERSRSAAAGLDIDVSVWDEERLAADGFGGILGVGQGSTRGPRLVKMSYSPTSASKHVAYVGKGITFDTGGLSLKPAGSMVGMKYDMTGAATVLAAIISAARRELPVRITSWLCIAENMPSGSATRPNDVLRIRGGKTVEVTNTDAEGRLVLADGLVAASEEYPDLIVDVATLTGAASVALGRRYAGLMGDSDLISHIADLAASVGEPMWPMPMPAELRPLLNSDIADLVNAKVGNSAGGMLVAALFLREFVGNQRDSAAAIPWAHIDIAGPANNPDAPYGFTGRGPSGVAVRTLVRIAEEYARP